ncbi:MAG: DoxX-like family protein [Bacteroidia bacterium]
MNKPIVHKIITYAIATVWLANGLLCKVLNMVPRHQTIVAHILGNEYAFIFTKLIGVSEIIMALWILSRFKTRINAIAQAIIIATMNTMEFILVPNLLLWGKFNSVFALLLICMVLYNEFILNKTANGVS